MLVDVAAPAAAAGGACSCLLCACGAPAAAAGKVADSSAPLAPACEPLAALPATPGINTLTGAQLLAAAPSKGSGPLALRLAAACACGAAPGANATAATGARTAEPAAAAPSCGAGSSGAALELLLAPGACPHGIEELHAYELAAPEGGDQGQGHGQHQAYPLQLIVQGAGGGAGAGAHCGKGGCLLLEGGGDGGVSWVDAPAAARLLAAEAGERGPAPAPPVGPLVWVARALFSAAAAAGCALLLGRR